MRNFRQGNNRSGFREGGRSGGNSFGGRSGSSRGGGFRRDDRKSFDMHEATCDKCGKSCKVPFRPTGEKPVYCSDCFRQNEGSGRNNFNSRGPSPNMQAQSGASSEQIKQINAKLDKILLVLQDLEIDTGDEIVDDLGDEDSEDSEDDADVGDDDSEDDDIKAGKDGKEYFKDKESDSEESA